MSKDRAQYLVAERHKSKIGAQRKADAELAAQVRSAVADYLGDKRTAVVCILDLCAAVKTEGKR